MKQFVIDIFCHYLPQKFYNEVLRVSNSPIHMLKRANAIPTMSNAEARVNLIKSFEGYYQIPCLVSPPLEYLAEPDDTPELARIANDEMALLIERNKDAFLGFVASIPMNNIEKALIEIERSVKILGACGVQIFTNVNGRPIDEECFLPIFEALSHLNVPIWLHPARGMNVPDYPCEEKSKYELWWTLGWPYETSIAMSRLVFSGLFERFPNIKIITHHAGGMIPMMEGRLGPGMDLFGTRTPLKYKHLVDAKLNEKPLNAFKHFYADTATFGSRSAIECGLAFFGAHKILFGTDMPFDPERGSGYIRRTLKAIQEMEIPLEHKTDILSGNAKKLLRISKSLR